MRLAIYNFFKNWIVISEEEDEDNGEEMILKVRLSSTCKDVKLSVGSNQSIARCKRRLHQKQELGSVRQRWYYGGKLLPDGLKIGDTHIPPTHVIQCVITELT